MLAWLIKRPSKLKTIEKCPKIQKMYFVFKYLDKCLSVISWCSEWMKVFRAFVLLLTDDQGQLEEGQAPLVDRIR